MIKIVRKLKSYIQNLFLNPFLQAMSSLPSGGMVTLFDVGAAGDIEPRWKVFSPYLNYVGFEPDERSCKQLLEKASSSDCYSYNMIPHALWGSKAELKLHLCAKPHVSSIYVPKIEFLKNFPQVERFDVISTEDFSVVPIDSLDLTSPDFMKLDVQGAELQILKGAGNLLDNVLGLEVEVEFVEHYENQPLFGDVCELLTKQGFEFIDFPNLCRWERHDFTGYGQCVWGDALFLRTPENMDLASMSNNKLSAYLSILLIYRRFDLIDVTIKLLPDKRKHILNEFHIKVAKAKNADRFGKKISEIFSRILNALDPNYKPHLLY